jgi:predicted nucleic acid-binding protein
MAAKSPNHHSLFTIHYSLFTFLFSLDGKADFLVTGDDDLLCLGKIENIPIVTFNQLTSKIK